MQESQRGEISLELGTLWGLPSKSLMELLCELGLILVVPVAVDYTVGVDQQANLEERGTTIEEKWFWSPVPSGGRGSGGVFQGPAIRVKLCGKRVVGSLAVLERRDGGSSRLRSSRE